MDDEILSENMSESKDLKLAQFQEITHLDDFEQCQAILESTNWDLDQAVQSYFSGGSAGGSLSNQHSIETQINQIEQVSEAQFRIEPSNLPNKRLLTFNIEYLGNKFQLHVPDNENVFKIKELIEEKLGIPSKNIKLNGWLNKNMHISDKMTLNELNLPLETSLYVVNTSDDSNNSVAQTSTSTQNEDNCEKIFELYIKILNETSQITIINQSSKFSFEPNHQDQKEDKFYRLNFEPNVKFIEIRRTLSKLTNIIANNQEWWYYKGDDLDEIKQCNNLASYHRLIESEKLFSLPLNALVEDSTCLNDIKKILDDLNQTSSKLTPPSTLGNIIKLGFLITSKNTNDYLEANPFESLLQNKSTSKQDLMESQDIDELEDDHMNNDDDLEDNFLHEDSSSSKKQKPLIPSDLVQIEDEALCTNSFVEEFSARYGPITPLFYIGKLEDAIREALLCPAKDRKLLGIYLHSDHTIFHNIFCSKTLCDENIVNFLSANFVVWPWDLTSKQNEAYFFDKCSKHLGSVFITSLKSMRDKFPVFLIVTRVRASNEVAAIIEGDSSNDMMMNRLMQTYEMFEMQRIKDESDEKTRDEREKIKREQDAAYQASIEYDKAKRQRQEEEIERMKQEAEKEAEIERKKEEELNNRKLNALNSLPPEPKDDVPINKTSKIRFRLPSGEFVQRKFLIETKLKILVDFITGHGYFAENYKLLSSWPRRDLTNENLEKTIEELKLFPQETLTLEER